MTKKQRQAQLRRMGYNECPICLYKFEDRPRSRHAPGKKPTIEHAPPQGLRPDKCIMVLTCQECNTRAGSQVDRFFLDGVREDLPGTIEVDGQVSRVRYRRKRSLWVTANEGRDRRRGRPSGEVLLAELSHPSTDEVVQIVEGGDVLPRLTGRDIGSIRLNWKTNERAADIGLLRAGYLVLYAQLGIIYARAPETRVIREQIQAPAEPLTKVKRMQVEEEVWEVVLCYLGSEWVWFVIIGHHGVFLPVIGETHWEDRGFHPQQLKAIEGTDHMKAIDQPFGSNQRRLRLKRSRIVDPNWRRAVEQVGVTGWEMRQIQGGVETRWISVAGSSQELVWTPMEVTSKGETPVLEAENNQRRE